MFRKPNSNTIDLGFLVEKSGLNNSSSRGGEGGSFGPPGMSTSYTLGLNGEETLGSGGHPGVVLMGDDPRLPLVPSRSWGELKMNGGGGLEGEPRPHGGGDGVANGRSSVKGALSSRSSNNINNTSHLIVSCRSVSNINNNSSSTNNPMHRGTNSTFGASTSTMNISRNPRTNTLINNSKSINSIVAYNNATNTITPFSSKYNKSSENIIDAYKDTNNSANNSHYHAAHTIGNTGKGNNRGAVNRSNNRSNNSSNNRHSSSTMSTKSTDSSTLSSSDSPTVGLHFIKPPSSFSSPSYNPQSFCGNFTPSPSNFVPQSTSGSSYSSNFPPPKYSSASGEQPGENSEGFPEYSTPATFSHDGDTNAIYTTPTLPTNASSDGRSAPNPPPLPPRFLPQPPPPPSSPPPTARETSTPPGERRGNFF
ncbi:hypothetical protein FHG87_020318 [Trinorchestia longiramus]|nr:hypothetical protein FHG87_020318 [Trinorchestia longiramus]